MNSPKKSFKGWNFKKWFVGNWKTIKELIKVGLPLVISVQILDGTFARFLSVIVGKFLIDAGEFWYKELK
ncbi:MAG: hypothetical protein ACOC5T_09770 [Elusimicrobiota bacterium]